MPEIVDNSGWIGPFIDEATYAQTRIVCVEGLWMMFGCIRTAIRTTYRAISPALRREDFECWHDGAVASGLIIDMPFKGRLTNGVILSSWMQIYHELDDIRRGESAVDYFERHRLEAT